ncbi:MAG TPA: hypothetical protein VHO23_00585 [Candidatus Paceibacterota bacterium]|nr:hypothetical protein [Candidatus Paceibacterota bacterium]
MPTPEELREQAERAREEGADKADRLETAADDQQRADETNEEAQEDGNE